jgi:outer membrane receptor protein involved in Fe transport
MSQSLRLRSLLAAGTSSIALLAIAAPAFAADPAPPTVGEVVVTAQKKEEALQDVPIAVSAFTQDSLEKAKIDGGPNLVLSVPNVNFSKGNFTGYNFQIRGIGSKLVAGSGDAGTGIHLNNTPLTANNLFEAEFFDLERVEVLRGPQGTLYGRNATGGVVNVITAKPVDHFEASLRAEIGNYGAKKLRGMINIPLGDMFALRVAGATLKRDGYGTNTVTGNDVDDRDLYNTRVTLAFNPTDTFSARLLWDHFNEDDSRSRIGRQLCSKDVGPTDVGGVAFAAGAPGGVERGFFSQGCRATPISASDIQGTINSQATLGGLFGILSGAQTGDAFAGKFQSSNIRDIEAYNDPIYQAKTDIGLLDMSWDLTDELTLSSVTSFTRNTLFTRQDYNRVLPTVGFNTPANINPVNLVGFAPGNALYTALFPGGVYNDPQVGRRDRFQAEDISSGFSKQFAQELRLQSNFDYPLNFSVGAIFVDFKATGDYYVMFNTGTSWYQINNNLGGNPTCAAGASNCVYIDPKTNPDRSGHNYYDSYGPYHLRSRALFGELYYQMTDDIKWTFGLRYTDDSKTVENHRVTLGNLGGGIGAPVDGTPAYSNVRFREQTGRFGVDWQPVLPFTDKTLVYATVSRGYKAGGLNTPCSQTPGVICPPATFAPEFIRSYEIGTKNTLLNGQLQLNIGAFMYDYAGYQVSKIVNRASTNENIDAKIKGVEIESIWAPITGLRLNANIGYLDTEITSGTSIDTFDRTGGNTDLIVVKSSAASNCVVKKTDAATALAISNATSAFNLLGVCSPTGSVASLAARDNKTLLLPGASTAYAVGINAFGGLVSDGAGIALKGKELPNAPHWTFSAGAQYTFDLGADWEATLRGDYYHQTETYSRIYNTIPDKLPEWDNVNLTLTINNATNGWSGEVFIKNATDEQVITDTYLTDDSSGLFRNGFYTEPKTYGVAITKKW